MSEPPAWVFVHSDDVRMSDLDLMAHLNNATFLVFVESACVAYFRSGAPTGVQVRLDGNGLVVAEQRITYRAPAHFGDRIDTHLRPEYVGRTSFRIEWEMRVGGREIANGYQVLVAYDRVAERPAPLPEGLRARLLADGARERTAAAAPLTKL